MRFWFKTFLKVPPATFRQSRNQVFTVFIRGHLSSFLAWFTCAHLRLSVVTS